MPVNLDPYMRRVEAANRRIADRHEAVGAVVTDLLRGTISEAGVTDDLPPPDAPAEDGAPVETPESPDDTMDAPPKKESDEAPEELPDDSGAPDGAEDDDFDFDDEDVTDDDGLDDLGLDDGDDVGEEPPADAP